MREAVATDERDQPPEGSNVEVVDWGAAANDVLTEQAERVLRLAGRL